MADYIAGRGTTALGIIGTVLGSIGTANALGGTAVLSGSTAPYEMRAASMHDIEDVQKMAEKDAEIARLKSEKYADSVKENAKEYVIDVYKQIESELRVIEKEQAAKWGEQSVVNAQVSDAITALTGKTTSIGEQLAQITRTAIPKSAICDFSGGCNGCGNSI